MEYFGCEFLDDGGYGKGVTSLPSPRIFYIATTVANRYADPVYYAKVANEDNSVLRADIAMQGIHSPAIMKYDERGYLRYHDGYHRLWVANQLRIETMPVVIEKARGQIRTWCLPFLAPDMLEYFEQVFEILEAAK